MRGGFKGRKPLSALAVLSQCRILPKQGPQRRKSKAARQSKSGRCGGWRLAAKELLPVRYSAPVAATKEHALMCCCAGHQAGSKQEARGAAVHERFAISGARALTAGWQAGKKRRGAVRHPATELQDEGGGLVGGNASGSAAE